MFTQKDFAEIDADYFTILALTGLNICLCSKNTRHLWTIHLKELWPNNKSLEIYHQHNKSDKPHTQPNFHPKNVIEAQLLIKDHDLYQIEERGKNYKTREAE